MELLATLQAQTSANAPLIIVAFILFTAALYCIPTLFSFFKQISASSERPSSTNDDTVFVCHDEAFMKANA